MQIAPLPWSTGESSSKFQTLQLLRAWDTLSISDTYCCNPLKAARIGGVVLGPQNKFAAWIQNWARRTMPDLETPPCITAIHCAPCLSQLSLQVHPSYPWIPVVSRTPASLGSLQQRILFTELRQEILENFAMLAPFSSSPSGQSWKDHISYGIIWPSPFFDMKILR